MESWRRNHGKEILKKDSLMRSLRGGILEEESWKMDPRRGFGGTSESSAGTPNSPLKASGACPEPPGPLSGLRRKVC